MVWIRPPPTVVLLSLLAIVASCSARAYRSHNQSYSILARRLQTCGDGQCNAHEDCSTCPNDCCPGVCPDGATPCSTGLDCRVCSEPFGGGEKCESDNDCPVSNSCEPILFGTCVYLSDSETSMVAPSSHPSSSPSSSTWPSSEPPSVAPSSPPSKTPSSSTWPSSGPSGEPTEAPSKSMVPSASPSMSAVPSSQPSDRPSAKPPLKVVVLTGQSNAQGYGAEEHLNALIQGIPGTPSRFDLSYTSDRLSHLKDSTTGNWTEWQNVYIYINEERQGQLSAMGFGQNASYMGPEVGLGWKLGNLLGEGEEILIIKNAFGGASLYADFRPPSSGINTAYTEPTLGYGWAYHLIVDLVLDTLDDIENIAPNYDPQVGFELIGLVYFQGFNDVLQWPFVSEYQANLENLIKDFREDLNEPNLKVVIGELGMQGPLAATCPTHSASLCPRDPLCTCCDFPRFCGRVSTLRAAQRIVAKNDDNVGLAETGMYSYGHVKNPLYPDYKEVWDIKQPHHYYRNADAFYYMGESMGEAMYKLLIK